MKDASDLRSKAKSNRAKRRDFNAEYKNDPDRVNFKNEKTFRKHEMDETDDEHNMEMRIGKGRK